MADLDAQLSNRLSRLAAAVPVSAGRLDPVHRGAVEARQRVRLAWLTPLVVIVAAVLLTSALGIGPFAPGATDDPGPVSATTRSGDFELSFRSEKSRYGVGEPLVLTASLTYVGSNDSISIGHGHGSPLSFGVVEPIDGVTLAPGWRLSCETTELARGVPIAKPFAKVGGFSGDDPRASEFEAFFADRTLTLDPGTWHPYAVAEFSIGECTADPIRMRVDLEIFVGETPVADPAVSDAGPKEASTRSGPFSLSLRAAHGTVPHGEPIEVSAILTYLGTESTDISHAFGAKQSPIGFGIDEPIFGDDRLGPTWDLACGSTTLANGAPLTVPFQKMAGSTDPATSELALFMNDPALRLPPGTWHVFAVARFNPGDCVDATDSAATVEMRVELAITVAGDVAPEPSILNPPEPTIAASPGPATPVIDTSQVGPYRLELRASRAVYFKSEAIDVTAAFTYLGGESIEIQAFHPLHFSIDEPVYGMDVRGGVTTSKCSRETLVSGERFESPFIKGTTISQTDPLSEDRRAFLDDPLLRLPPGIWHVHAYSTFTGGACGDPSTVLSTTIEIKVLRDRPDPANTEPPIRATPEPPPDGSPLEIDRDDLFELRMDPPSWVFRADEAIELSTSYAFIGPELDVLTGHFAPEVGFSLEELDAAGNPVGEGLRMKIYDSACGPQPLHQGVAREARISDDNLMYIRASSLPGKFYTDLDNGIFRLAPGRWRIRASLTTYVPGCSGGEQHDLDVTVELAVVPSSWTRLPIRTAQEPVSACALARGGGRLVADPISGIGTALADGSSSPVQWPYGWTGWRNATGVVLLNGSGRFVAREGDMVTFGGAPIEHGGFYACTGIARDAGAPSADAIRIELLTADQPNLSGICRTALASGELGPNATSGIGIGVGEITEPMRWPFGWTGWQDGADVVLLDASGRVVGRTGDVVEFGGGLDLDEIFAVCG